jgi:phosphotransferase system enzyme I (PtsP)
VEDVHAEGKTVSVCGEMAGDPSAAVLLMAMGYDILSMNANSLPKVKSVIRKLHIKDAQKLLAEIMSMSDMNLISQHIRDTLTTLGVNPRLLHSKTDA